MQLALHRTRWLYIDQLSELKNKRFLLPYLCEPVKVKLSNGQGNRANMVHGSNA